MLESYIEEIEKEKSKIFNFAKLKYNINIDNIEDIYQDTILSLIKSRINYRSNDAKLTTWFTRCFLNKCVSYIRKKYSKKKINYSELDIMKLVENNEERDLLKIISSEEDSEKILCEVLKQVESLNPKFKDIVKMRYLDGMKNKKIAERLNVPKKTIAGRLHYAKTKLKRKLEHLIIIN